VNGNVTNAIRRSGLEHSDQIRNSVEVNPFTDLLQILEHRLERQNAKPHSRGGEGGHTHVGTNVDDKPVLALALGLLEQVLNGDGDVGLAKGLPFEHPHDVLVGLVGEGSEIGEGEEEGVAHALDGVGDDGVSLRRGGAVEGGDCIEREAGVEGDEGRGGGV